MMMHKASTAELLSLDLIFFTKSPHALNVLSASTEIFAKIMLYRKGIVDNFTFVVNVT